MVSEISRAAKTEAINFRFTVNDRDRLKARAKQIERTLDGAEFHLGKSAEFVVCIKNIAEHIAQKFRRLGPGIKRKFIGLMAVAQWPEIVEAEDVVGVGVGIEDRVDVANLLANGLFAKIRRGIDEDCSPVILDQN